MWSAVPTIRSSRVRPCSIAAVVWLNTIPGSNRGAEAYARATSRDAASDVGSSTYVPRMTRCSRPALAARATSAGVRPSSSMVRRRSRRGTAGGSSGWTVRMAPLQGPPGRTTRCHPGSVDRCRAVHRPRRSCGFRAPVVPLS
ncbi:hypothetical protein SDC9_101128 [bioreactor metagenome]|uniref:Uncharacterized protein n=1 Tax=bioreactor metagenome TaxID=1076179 RepID=A0A645AMK4_9ZZZZ